MKIKHYVILVLLLALVVFVYIRYYYVFADGTKAGVLNTFQRKGYVWKTYEGKIIQSGFKVNVQSNEFNFSVLNESVAKILMENAGKEVELHYKCYFGTLPWRGMQQFIVDSVYEIRNANGESILSPKIKN
jgi:hypothetical protein